MALFDTLVHADHNKVKKMGVSTVVFKLQLFIGLFHTIEIFGFCALLSRSVCSGLPEECTLPRVCDLQQQG